MNGLDKFTDDVHNWVSGFPWHSCYQSRPIYRCFSFVNPVQHTKVIIVSISSAKDFITNWMSIHLSCMRVDNQTTFGNLQCGRFDWSSCRCSYIICKILFGAHFLIFRYIMLQSHVIKLKYYDASTPVHSTIRALRDYFSEKFIKSWCFRI